MGFLQKALEALPSIAQSPLAFIGYILTLAAWVYAVFRTRRLKLLVGQLQNIPEADRARTLQLELDEVIPDTISPAEWIQARKQRYFLIAFLALLITGLAITAIAIYEGMAKAKTEAVLRQQDEIRRQHQRAIEEKRYSLQKNMNGIDQKIREAESEIRRGASGLAFAPSDQKPIAIQIMETAKAEKAKLIEEKKKLQEDIDRLPIE